MAKRTISIESNNQQLDGRLFIPTQAEGSAILFIHGFGARGRTCEQYAKRLVKAGIVSLTFDLSGHGDSTGNSSDLSVNDHVSDVDSAFDYLRSQNEVAIDPKRIGIAGMSYGGYLALLPSGTRNAKSLLLRSPPLYPKALQGIARREYTDEQALQSVPELDNPALQALHTFAGKVCLVTSELDTVVAPVFTNLYAQTAISCEEFVLKGAHHSLDSFSQQQFLPIVDTWAAEL